MNKLIGGVIFSHLTGFLFATIDLWKNTQMQDLFTLILSAILAIGSFIIGAQIVQWFEENDTTGATNAN